MRTSQLPESQRKALNLYVKWIRTTNQLTQRIHEHLKAENLTISQFGVLEALYHLGPLSQTELGEKILRSNANLTTVVDSLEKKRLVVRNRSEEDRRRISVQLTDSGETLIGEVFPRHAEIVDREMAVWSPQEQETMRKLFGKTSW